MKGHVCPQASALLVVMTALTGLTVLLTTWWQAAGWASDLVLVRQQCISRFYSTEVVLNYGLAWVKKSFDRVITDLDRSVGDRARTKKARSMTVDGGTVNLGPGQPAGVSTLTIDRAPNDERPEVVRVTATVMVDGRVVTCHRCLLERETVGSAPGQNKKEYRFVVHHFSFSAGG